MKEIRGNFSGQGKRIAICVSRFNEFISNQLFQGCIDTLKKSGVEDKDILVIWTPGAFEIPQVISKLKANKFDAVIALGAIIRGETPHFDYIASEVSKGVSRCSQEKAMPVVFGIITADTLDQAIERSGIKQGNKGRDAALTALEMIAIYIQL